MLVPITVPLIPAAALLVAEREWLEPSNLVTIALAGLSGAVVYLAVFLCFPQAGARAPAVVRGSRAAAGRSRRPTR